MAPGDVFFGFEGRISRRLFLACAGLVVATAAAIRGALSEVAPSVLSPGAVIMATVIGSILIFGGTLTSMSALIVKRLHDLQRPGEGAVFTFVLPSLVATLVHTLQGFGLDAVPLFTMKVASLLVLAWSLSDLLFAEGTEGPNAFGPDPVLRT